MCPIIMHTIFDIICFEVMCDTIQFGYEIFGTNLSLGTCQQVYIRDLQIGEGVQHQVRV